jgi:hypothetical protein
LELRPSKAGGFTVSSVDTKFLSTALSRQVAAGASAEQIATSLTSTWQAIELALWPIVGKVGVAALFQRSLVLAARIYPWLPSDATSGCDIKQLHAILARQPSDVAADAGGAFLQAFHDLLATLVGPSLTGRLLGSVWETLSSGPAAQDAKP